MQSVSIASQVVTKRLTECILCGSANLSPWLDLGSHYLPLFLPTPVGRYALAAPLSLNRCECGMVQLRDAVPRDFLFRHYWYRSGVNDTMTAHLKSLARGMGAYKGQIWVDIGANDGTLLAAVPEGVTRVAFEPATDFQEELRKVAAFVVADFFTADAYMQMTLGHKADIVTSLAMFYDLLNPLAFCQDVAKILADDGTWVCEFNYLGSLLDNAAFDFIGHEHVGHYLFTTFSRVVREAGLQVQDVELNGINGGSLRCYIKKPYSMPSTSTVRLSQNEALKYTPASYAKAVRLVETVKESVSLLVRGANFASKTVMAYGASTRGMTLLQACGLDRRNIEAAVDKNPLKVGRYMAGLDIPIISEDQMRQEKPDYLLMLPWGFAEEFVERERAYLERGGRFIVPLPQPKVLGG